MLTNYTAHRLGQPAPAWTRNINALKEASTPAESYGSVRESMKQLTTPDTPHELASRLVAFMGTSSL